MAIAPITGKLRKRLFVDIAIGLGGGGIAGYAWWYGYHVPKMRHQESIYAQMNAEREKQGS